MNLTDIIALAKQGYKPSDIKELLEIGNTQLSADDSSPETEPKGEDIPPTAPPEEVEKTEDDTEKDRLIKQLQSQIRELQQSNTRISRAEEPKQDYHKTLEDMARNFM